MVMCIWKILSHMFLNLVYSFKQTLGKYHEVDTKGIFSAALKFEK